MIGILERVLQKHFGPPEPGEEKGRRLRVFRDQLGTRSTLYLPDADPSTPAVPARLEAIYGDACAASVLQGALGVCSLSGPEIYGLYPISELDRQPAVIRARALDPGILFFATASNVWFYGEKNGELFVYDEPFDELDTLGPTEKALDDLVGEWEEVHLSTQTPGSSGDA